MSETRLGVALRLDFGSDFEDADEFREIIATRAKEGATLLLENTDGTNELSFTSDNCELVVNDGYYGIDYIVTEVYSGDFSEFSLSADNIDDIGAVITDVLGAEITGIAKDVKITFYQWHTSVDKG